jgi:hypothetical protein
MKYLVKYAVLFGVMLSVFLLLCPFAASKYILFVCTLALFVAMVAILHVRELLK